MPVGCCVPGCRYYELAHSIGIPFHSFPRDSARRREWIIAVRNAAIPINASFERVKDKRVCGKHFLPSVYERDHQFELMGGRKKNVLKKDAIPTLFSFNTPATAVPVRGAYEKREAIRQAQAESEMQPQATSKASASAAVVDEASSVVPGPSDPDSDFVFSSPFSSPVKESGSSSYRQSSSEDVTSDVSSSSSDEPEILNIPPGIEKIVVEIGALMDLFRRCQECGEGIVDRKCSFVGAKFSVKWECVKGHDGQWDSSSIFNGMSEINLLFTAATVLSGNTYQSVSSLADILKMKFLSKTTFNDIQASYVLPTIDEEYQAQKSCLQADLILRSMDEEAISLLGDGRSDSPGFSAKYTAYSVMEESTKKIVDMQLVQVTETTSSVAMEKEGFVRSMEGLLDNGVKVTTMTTDRSPSIRKVMREKYPETGHEFDCWHICKGVKKKCSASGRVKGNEVLLRWTKSITNHLWYCSSSCNGDVDELLRSWLSILHHVLGVHRWEDEDGTQHTCGHGPLSDDDQRLNMWFREDTPAYRALKKIVTDPRLLKDIRQLTLFKHTGHLEAFHSTLLKFAPKRLHFRYPAMMGRMQLAVIDHNSNVDRAQATTRDGRLKYRYVSSRQSGGEWRAKAVYNPKSYEYAHDLMDAVVARRLNKAVKYKSKESHVKTPALPQNIAKRPRPPIADLLAARF